MKIDRKVDLPREKLARLGARELSLVEILTLLISSGYKNHSASDLAQGLVDSVEGDLIVLARYNIYDFKKDDSSSSYLNINNPQKKIFDKFFVGFKMNH